MTGTLWPRAGDAWLYSGDALRPAADALFFLWLIFIGMLLFSAGFFAAHSVASSWIGPAPAAPAVRRHRCICSAIIWVQSCRDVRQGILASLRLERRRWVYPRC